MRQKFRRLTTTLALSLALGCSSGETSSSTSLASDTLTQSALSSASTGGAVTVAAQTGFCLDIGGNSNVNGTRVGIYGCNKTEAQTWTFDNGLIRASNNRCLNVIDGNEANNTRLQIWTCSATDKNMLFTIKGNTIRWTLNSKCLDVVNGDFVNNNPVQLYDCFDDAPNQTWNLASLTTSTAASTTATTATTATTTTTASTTTTTTTSSSSGMLDGFVANATQIAWSSWTPQILAQGQVNNEQEAYVTDGSTISYDSGTLVITAYSNNNSYGWKSGKLQAPMLGTSRGYIEANMNTPSAQGTWPAFWLMPNNNSPTWPQGGEIDIMEQVNGQPTQNVSTHYGPSPSQTTDTHITMSLPNMSGEYHRYGVAWDQTHCAFYVDGVKVPGSVVYYPSNSPFAKDVTTYTPILNLAIGGSWPGYAADSIGNQVLKVKYVAQSVETPSDF